jgi:hypothetical protein
MGVAVRIVSYSVTTTTPGTGSSITSMIVSLTGTSTACLGVLLGAFLAALFDCRCLFAAPLTLDFACFGVMRFAAFLRAGLVLALPRLELFLRVATRFFALAMAVSREVCRRQAKSWISIRAIRETELYTYCAGHRAMMVDVRYGPMADILAPRNATLRFISSPTLHAFPDGSRQKTRNDPEQAA